MSRKKHAEVTIRFMEGTMTVIGFVQFIGTFIQQAVKLPDFIMLTISVGLALPFGCHSAYKKYKRIKAHEEHEREKEEKAKRKERHKDRILAVEQQRLRRILRNVEEQDEEEELDEKIPHRRHLTTDEKDFVYQQDENPAADYDNDLDEKPHTLHPRTAGAANLNDHSPSPYVRRRRQLTLSQGLTQDENEEEKLPASPNLGRAHNHTRFTIDFNGDGNSDALTFGIPEPGISISISHLNTGHPSARIFSTPQTNNRSFVEMISTPRSQDSAPTSSTERSVSAIPRASSAPTAYAPVPSPSLSPTAATPISTIAGANLPLNAEESVVELPSLHYHSP